MVWHGVAERADEPAAHVSPSVATAVFTAQLEAIARSYEVVRLPDLPSAVQRRAPGARLPVALTFDDDLASHAEIAAPLLERFGLPATFFLTGATLERPAAFWWDDLQVVFDRDPGQLESELGPWRRDQGIHALAGWITGLQPERRAEVAARLHRLAGAQPPPGLPADRVRWMASAGFEIGFHTLRHDSTLTLDDRGLEKAMTEGRDELVAAAGSAVSTLAYPHGRADARSATAARAAGLDLGVVTGGAAVRPGDDRLLLSRVDGWTRSSAEMNLRLARATAPG